MAAKALLICASALFVQSAVSQCFSRISAGCGCDGLGYAGAWNGGRLGCGGAELAASYGGGLGVASASAYPPVGLAVESDNAYEGCVEVVGNLPFLGTSHVEGIFPTKGSGGIRYGCGDGAVAITAEGPISGGIGYGTGLGYGVGLGLENGIGYKGNGCGCGCGIF